MSIAFIVINCISQGKKFSGMKKSIMKNIIKLNKLPGFIKIFINMKSKRSGAAYAASNAGFSLPEVIISMLILSIAVAPLLTNFAVTARVNARSQAAGDATDFAQQIAEGLEARSADEVDKQLTGAMTAFRLVDLGDSGSFGRTDSSFSSAASGDGTAISADSSPRYYFIKDAKAANGRTYDVQITYDPGTYSSAGAEAGSVHAYNITEFPDVSVFSQDSTAIIEADKSFIEYTSQDGGYVYDEQKGSYAFQQNDSYESQAVNVLYDRYISFLASVADALNDELQVRGVSDIEAHLLDRSDFTGTQSESQKKNELTGHLKRSLIIKLAGDDGKIQLSAYERFELTNDTYVIDETVAANTAQRLLRGLTDSEGDEISFSADEIKDLVHELADTARGEGYENIRPTYRVWFGEEGYSELQSIYLMYTPLGMSYYSDTIAIDMSDAALSSIYNENSRLDLYLVPQLGLLSDADSEKYLKPEVAGCVLSNESAGSGMTVTLNNIPYNKLTLSYVKGWIKENALVAGNSRQSVVKTASGNIIYDINIKIFKSDAGRWSEKLAELNVSAG